MLITLTGAEGLDRQKIHDKCMLLALEEAEAMYCLGEKVLISGIREAVVVEFIRTGDYIGHVRVQCDDKSHYYVEPDALGKLAYSSEVESTLVKRPHDMTISSGEVVVYKVMARVAIRIRPDLSLAKSNTTGEVLEQGVCISGYVLPSEKSFLRLESGKGYIPLVSGTTVCCKWIPVQRELCAFRVLADCIALRSSPDYSPTCASSSGAKFGVNALVIGEALVCGEYGDVFVHTSHPTGEKGWVFATRKGDTLLKRISLRSLRNNVVDSENSVPAPGSLTATDVLDIHTVARLAGELGYSQIQFNKASRVISFGRGQVRINVYYTTGTVSTSLDHPVQGKTQLFRRKVDIRSLREIFDNPRMHTGAGYHRRANKPGAQDGKDSHIGAPNEETALSYALLELEKEAYYISQKHAELSASLRNLRVEKAMHENKRNKMQSSGGD
jgi:hypothetical protein